MCIIGEIIAVCSILYACVRTRKIKAKEKEQRLQLELKFKGDLQPEPALDRPSSDDPTYVELAKILSTYQDQHQSAHYVFNTSVVTLDTFLNYLYHACDKKTNVVHFPANTDLSIDQRFKSYVTILEYVRSIPYHGVLVLHESGTEATAQDAYQGAISKDVEQKFISSIQALNRDVLVLFLFERCDVPGFLNGLMRIVNMGNMEDVDDHTNDNSGNIDGFGDRESADNVHRV
ncbi:unnamed protein product [Bursaphelenchus okinawaensis]|uniref:Uncharacterized protein n=1 Tax=Bursaphelenchus okinawaensis TaxID=465554 RepID=A0A811L1W5_9BILA|nr:unnamed protein product [Bursaphelenchus okinawaensis]CAG9114712.1 unnamed protein product [Bursaphelenchus okinawaensis]